MIAIRRIKAAAIGAQTTGVKYFYLGRLTEKSNRIYSAHIRSRDFRDNFAHPQIAGLAVGEAAAVGAVVRLDPVEPPLERAGCRCTVEEASGRSMPSRCATSMIMRTDQFGCSVFSAIRRSVTEAGRRRGLPRSVRGFGYSVSMPTRRQSAIRPRIVSAATRVRSVRRKTQATSSTTRGPSRPPWSLPAARAPCAVALRGRLRGPE